MSHATIKCMVTAMTLVNFRERSESMIENPMVIDRLWKHQEQEPKTIGYHCEGCSCPIIKGEPILELTNNAGEKILLHQDSDCTYQYVAGMAYHKVAGE